MSENNDPGPEVPPAPAASSDVEQAAPSKRTWRERLAGSRERAYGVRGLVAATLAALIVGGVGGAAIHAAVDGERHEHRGFSRGEHPDGPGDFDRRGPGDLDRRGPVPLPPSLPATPTPSESSDS